MARRDDLFIMRINGKERKLIAALAEREGTSASEAVRIVIRQAAQTSERAPAWPQAAPTKT